MRLPLLLTLALLASPFSALAAPPMWEDDIGNEIVALTGCDDCNEDVVLGFNFPFAGANYTVLSVGTNGGIYLHNTAGEDPYFDYDYWDEDEFIDGGDSDCVGIDCEGFSNSGKPAISPFGADLDQGSSNPNGTIYFNDFGDRAVVTWVLIGTNQRDSDDFALLTMQVQLFDDGTIVFGYMLEPGVDLVNDLDTGIVVGISEGTTANPSGSDDFTADSPFDGGTTIYETWCYDEDPNAAPGDSDCFEPGRDDNSGFDLDDLNLVFIPLQGGGYAVSFDGEVVGTLGGGSGGCTVDPTGRDPFLALLLAAGFGGLAWRRRRARIAAR